MEEDKPFPWHIQNLEPKVAEALMTYFKGECSGFVRVGPKGYFMPHKYRQEASTIYNLKLREGDTFIASYPRSGSTWLRELVWLVSNDLNYDVAKATSLIQRFLFLEISVVVHSSVKQKLLEETTDPEKIKLIEMLSQPCSVRIAGSPSPRFIYTHLPLSLLPPNLLDSAKLVYVARDPRDVVVSFYHLNRLNRALGYVGDFKTYWNIFINDLHYWTPYFEHIKEGWAKRHHPNILFLFYENISKNLPDTVRRVSSFLNKQLTEEQVSALCAHLSIENFRKNKSVNYDLMEYLGVLEPGEEPFIRKGKVGGWRDYFDEEMEQQAERWMADNLRDTDLQFPHIDTVIKETKSSK